MFIFKKHSVFMKRVDNHYVHMQDVNVYFQKACSIKRVDNYYVHIVMITVCVNTMNVDGSKYLILLNSKQIEST